MNYQRQVSTETRDRNSIKDKHGTKAYKGNKPKEFLG